MWSTLTPVIVKMAYVEERYFKNDTIEDNYVAEIRRLHLTSEGRCSSTVELYSYKVNSTFNTRNGW